MNIHPTGTEGYQLLHEGILALADAEEYGMNIDINYCKKKRTHLTRRIERAEKKIEEYEEVKFWKKKYGSKFKIGSDQQLGDILFNDFGHEAKIFTNDKKTRPSTSQEALEQLNVPFVKDYVEIKRLKKTRDTYLENYIKESVSGILRPFFHLHTVRTYRGSASQINFQNQPVRIPEIKKLVRSAVIPRPGFMIGEIDFSGIEVRIAACYHNDPNMIKEIIDPARDMHRDMAQECYLLGDNEWTKETRYCGKNKFVFPQFYGDYYGNNARDLWASILQLNLETRQGTPLKIHLKKKNIKTYKQFEKHIQKVEKDFWTRRFKVYGEWKNTHWKEYLKKGYVDIKTGFRCAGLMSRNDAINYPIQGAAFHCLLWSLIQLNRWLKENNMLSKIIGQIHDSLVMEIHPDEANVVLATAKYIMTEAIRKYWDWIIVPLDIEVELTPVNGSWYFKKETIVPDDFKCDCGMEWLYQNKTETAIIWNCPVCGNRYETVLH